MGLFDKIKSGVSGIVNKAKAIIAPTAVKAVSAVGGLISRAPKTAAVTAVAATLKGNRALKERTGFSLLPKIHTKAEIAKQKETLRGILPGRAARTVTSGIISGNITNSTVTSAAAGVTKTGAAASGGNALSTQLKNIWNDTPTVAKYAAGAAAVGGLLYGAEQIAEAAGVRGGAGFIGKKPRKRKTTTKKRKKATKRKYYKKSSSKKRRSKKKGYGTSKQYARKGGKTVHRTKNGQPYIILNDGRARFIKKSKRD